MAHAEISPPRDSLSKEEDVAHASIETGPKVVGEARCAQIIEELAAVTANQAALVAQLKEKYAADESLVA